eukprot:TRINITY_DN35933_c0_g1_i1.p1 TRINITY_DN35933_c0_g1~~TRINITY_DN35933_c0_g1_i1.p1  ORF type:complete len:853 (-),score=146.90 TRINITY_DN35933_c0_g1_i1:261-2483(-)
MHFIGMLAIDLPHIPLHEISYDWAFLILSLLVILLVATPALSVVGWLRYQRNAVIHADLMAAACSEVVGQAYLSSTKDVRLRSGFDDAFAEVRRYPGWLLFVARILGISRPSFEAQVAQLRRKWPLLVVCTLMVWIAAVVLHYSGMASLVGATMKFHTTQWVVIALLDTVLAAIIVLTFFLVPFTNISLTLAGAILGTGICLLHYVGNVNMSWSVGDPSYRTKSSIRALEHVPLILLLLLQTVVVGGLMFMGRIFDASAHSLVLATKVRVVLAGAMPWPVARDLARGVRPAYMHRQCGIIFADMVGFSTLVTTRKLDSLRVVQLLEEFFRALDCAVATWGCTRVKTIGDGFLAISRLRFDDNADTPSGGGAAASASQRSLHTHNDDDEDDQESNEDTFAETAIAAASQDEVGTFLQSLRARRPRRWAGMLDPTAKTNTASRPSTTTATPPVSLPSSRAGPRQAQALALRLSPSVIEAVPSSQQAEGSGASSPSVVSEGGATNPAPPGHLDITSMGSFEATRSEELATMLSSAGELGSVQRKCPGGEIPRSSSTTAADIMRSFSGGTVLFSPLGDHSPTETAAASASATRVVLAAIHMHLAAEAVGVAIRAGVNVGDLVSGVVGCARFAWDVWGPSVNVAARLEQVARPGGVATSRDVFSLLAAPLSSLFTVRKHPVFLKGVGEVVLMDCLRDQLPAFIETVIPAFVHLVHPSSTSPLQFTSRTNRQRVDQMLGSTHRDVS